MNVDCKCLYVKGLNRSTTSDDLRPLFEETGPVITVKKLSPATAIVSYTDADHARNAIKQLHGSRLHNKVIHVDFKKEKTSHHLGPNQDKESGAYGSSELSESIPVALHILKYMSTSNSAKAVLRNLKASLDLKNSCISIHGDRHGVNKATREIEQLAGSFSESTYRSSDVFRQCFRQIKPAEVVEVFKANHIFAGWDLHDGQLYTCSDSVQSARRSLELIQDMIVEWKYPMDRVLSTAQMNLVESHQWFNLNAQLKEEDLTNSLQIDCDHSSRKILLALRSGGNRRAVIRALEQFFEPLSSHNKMVSLGEEAAQLVFTNKKYVLKQCCEEGATLDLDHLLVAQKCTVTCSSDAVFDAVVAKLKSVIKHRVQKAVSFCKLSSVEWLKSPFGCSKLADITSLTRTLSETTKQKVRQKVKSDFYVPAHIMQAAAAGSPLSLVQEEPGAAHRVKIVKGDISGVEVDGLISCCGAVANAITNKYGVSLSKGLQILRFGGQRNMYIYHIHLEAWRSSLKVTLLHRFREQVKKAYCKLSAYKPNTIAIPAIGIGDLGYPPENVASIILEAVITSLKANIDQNAWVVVHQQQNIHKLFEGELQKYTPKPQPRAVVQSVEVEMIVEHLTVTFTSLKETGVTKAISKLQEEIKHGIISTHWGDLPSDKAVIMKLTHPEVIEIRTQASKNHVDAMVEVGKGIIVLEGIKDHMNMTRDFVNNILRSKSSALSLYTFPSHWDQLALAKGRHEVILNLDTEEYRRVHHKFFKTCHIVDLEILEITRIQNEHLYTQYEAQKSKIKKELSGDKTIEIERQLWHGTTAESVKQICANEFNRSFAGAHGMTYGQGSYFSTSSAYAVSYSEGQGYKYMILAKVLTGRYLLGTPNSQRKNLPAGVHSTVNNQSYPAIFVVYHDASAYPEYVIKFTTKAELRSIG